MRQTLIGILFCCACLALHAQSYLEIEDNLRFRNLSITSGLSHASVQDVMQDQYGYLWVATRDGLNRYDGKSFRVYKHQPDDSTSVASNAIMNIFERSNGELWISTQQGLSIYDYKKDAFINMDSQPGLEPFFRNIAEDANGNLWIASHAGLVKFDGQDFTYFKADPDKQNSIDDNTILSVARYEDQLYVGTMEGLNIFNLDNETFQNAKNSDLPIFNTNDYFFKSICITADRHVWLGSFDDELGGIVRRYNPSTQAIQLFEPDSVNAKALNFNFAILDIFTDNQNQVWIGTNGAGLHLYDSEINGFKKFEPELKSSYALNDPDIWAIWRDQSGVLWIGTDGGGLYKSHEIYSRFSLTSNNPYDQNTLNVNDVHSFEEDERFLWIGTNVGGVNRYDKQTGIYKSYNITDDKSVGLWDYTIYDLEIDQNGSLWIGTNTGGLSKLDPNTQRFVHFRYDATNPLSLSNNVIFCIEPDGQNLWIGTADGLNRINTLTNDISRVDLQFESSSRAKLINSIARMNKFLWIGADVGLLVKNLETNQVERKALFDDLEKHIEVHALVAANDRLWVATDVGLAKIENGQVDWLSQNNDLAGNAVLDVEIDDRGQIWALGRQFVAKIYPETFEATTFPIDDNQHNFRSFFLGLDGQMYVGGINGYISFDPISLKKSNFQPKVYFTVVNQILDGKLKQIPLSGLSKVDLDHDQNHFSINFLVSDLVNPDKNQFGYRINDKNGDWIDLGNTSNIPFVDLSPGNYNLEVRASNSDGVWSEHVSEFLIVINPPWWQTSWFRIFAALLILVAFYAFHKWRLRSIKKQKVKLESEVKERTSELEKSKNQALQDKDTIEKQAEKLEALDKVKSRFFANISHELRTPITLINGPVEAMINGEYGKVEDELLDGLAVVKHNGKSLLSLVNEILDLTKLEAGKLELNKVPVMLHTFLTDIVDAFKLQASQKQIALKFEFDLPEDLVLHIDERRVKKIIDNLLSNAIKYTGDGGEIKLEALQDKNWFQLNVQDSGMGIYNDDLVKIFDRFYQSDQPTAKALGGTGIGLALAKELAKLTKGDLTVESELGKGSIFSYRFRADQMNSEKMEGLQSVITEDGLHLAMEETVATYSDIFDIERPKVLLVEDHPIMRMFTKKILEPYFSVHESTDGLEGLHQLRKHDFDLVISDVMMPNLDGFELLEKVKDDDVLKNISVIMLTARAEEEDKLFALTIGVDDYMLKPFSPNELLARTKNILQNRMARTEVPNENGHSKELSADQKFLIELKEIVENNIDSSLLSVSYLAQQVAMSERQLLRRIKNITGFSPNQFIREVRLQKAKTVLEKRQVYTVAEAAYAVGYEKVHYFSTQYTERFGKKPSEELKG